MDILARFVHLQVEEKRVGGTLRIALLDDVKTLNPIWAMSVWDWFILGLIYDSLVATDPHTLEPIPWVAEGWKMISPTHWVWYIRDDVYWHDGHKLDAYDVAFTYNFFRFGAATAGFARYITYAKFIKNVWVEEPNKVHVELYQPYAPFVRYLGGLILPGHGIMLRALEGGTAGLRVPTGEVWFYNGEGNLLRHNFLFPGSDYDLEKILQISFSADGRQVTMAATRKGMAPVDADVRDPSAHPFLFLFAPDGALRWQKALPGYMLQSMAASPDPPTAAARPST